jgi:hypothetical protein
VSENYPLKFVVSAVGAGARYFRGAKGDHREPWSVSPSLRAAHRPLSPQRKALMLSRTIPLRPRGREEVIL